MFRAKDKFNLSLLLFTASNKHPIRKEIRAKSVRHHARDVQFVQSNAWLVKTHCLNCLTLLKFSNESNRGISFLFMAYYIIT